jgi:two-component system response regulator NreC
MEGTIRVLLADDHPVTRAGIRAILEGAPDIAVVAEAKDGLEAQQLVAEFCPRILLLDLVMPGPRPREIEAWVRAHYPETITLVLTAHDRDVFLAEAIGGGVAGFLTKEEAPQRLVEAVRRAARGDVLISGEQLARARHWREEVGERWESLTEREREVLRLLTQGLDNVTIADEMRVTVRTVESHVTNILRKLEVSSRLEAATWARDRLPDDLWKSTG